MSKVTIIGAGGTGRGFIARLLLMDGASISFIDNRPELINALNQKESYTIYVGDNETPFVVNGYDAHELNDPVAITKAADADYLMISIGLQNYPQLKSFLSRVAEINNHMRIIVCENGISPKSILEKTLKGTAAENAAISQGIIFCTSIEKTRGDLDIVSQEYNQLPYDTKDCPFVLPFKHFIPETDFAKLMQRKIYTYNCLSACIAYLGYLKGYTDYGEAGRDPQISSCCEQLRYGLDHVVVKTMCVSSENQHSFSQAALDKFRSRTIRDTISKNVRDASRKISPEERLMGPLRLFEACGENADIICLVIAAAMVYLDREEKDSLGRDAWTVFCESNPSLSKESQYACSIRQYYNALNSGSSWMDLINLKREA